MKYLYCILFFSLAYLGVQAQNSKPTETNYLVGAVPEKNGVVVFEESYTILGATKSEIFEALKTYAEKVVNVEDKLPQSRITEVSLDDGVIAASVEEYLWFKRNAWVWDRTRFLYQLVFLVSDQHFEVALRRIRYIYDAVDVKGEPTVYAAEDWITDREALKRNGMQLTKVAGKKFRVKTIDRKNELFRGALEACKNISK